MRKKIKINQGELVVFLGSMNAMPMMYAWELKKCGYDVLYFVDAPKKDTLSRPENHFPDIGYPYPDWIIEIKIATQMALPYAPYLFALYIKNKIKQIWDKKISCFVLNGFFISLAPYLRTSSDVVALSHGSDLDVWADKEKSKNLATSFCEKSFFKYLPYNLSKLLIARAVAAQYDGFSASTSVVYFPVGFNKAGDRVISSLSSDGPAIFSRYDISFEPLRGIPRNFKIPSDKLKIFSGVRFLYKTFPEGNKDYSKGNDLIIRGLAKYFKRNKNIEIHFVEKGEDVIQAKRLCSELGLEKVVVWHKEMPFKKMIELYLNADICFDQVGAHWIGAVGAYALFLGKPLIANIDSLISLNIFPADNPIMSANDEISIFNKLMLLESTSFRKKIHLESKEFVERKMGCGKLLNEVFDFCC